MRALPALTRGGVALLPQAAAKAVRYAVALDGRSKLLPGKRPAAKTPGKLQGRMDTKPDLVVRARANVDGATRRPSDTPKRHM
jgi:hypothetical protein